MPPRKLTQRLKRIQKKKLATSEQIPDNSALRNTSSPSILCERFARNFLRMYSRAVGRSSPTIHATSRSSVPAMAETCMSFPTVWNNAFNREHVIGILLEWGVEVLTDSKATGGVNVVCATGYAGAILLLENRDRFKLGTKHAKEIKINETDKHFLKMRDVLDGCQRTLLRFYSKRIPGCSRLADMYAEAKCQPKIGFCDHCKGMKRRKKLMVCSLCRGQHYCSRQCQVAHWPKHKKVCSGLAQWKRARSEKGRGPLNE